MVCPSCNSERIIRNGTIHNGKQKYACKNCSRQFVENPQNVIPQQTKDLVDKLLLERISLAGISRVTGVSERWLQYYVNDKYENIEQKVKVTKKIKEN